MDINSSLFTKHMKLQRNFEYQMDRWDRSSPEALTKREISWEYSDVHSEFGNGPEFEAVKAKYSEALRAWRDAREAMRLALIDRFDKQSREIGGPGFDAWQDILCQVRTGMTCKELMATDGP